MTRSCMEIIRTSISGFRGNSGRKSGIYICRSGCSFPRSSGLQDFPSKFSTCEKFNHQYTRTYGWAVWKSGTPDDLRVGKLTRNNAPGLCPGLTPDMLRRSPDHLRNLRTAPAAALLLNSALTSADRMASAMANPKQAPSKLLQQPKQVACPAIPPSGTYRQAVQRPGTPQDLHPAGSAGIPEGSRMAYVGCPQAVHSRCASEAGCHDTPGPSRRESRRRHTELGPLGGLAGPLGGPSRARNSVGVTYTEFPGGLVPQGDQSRSGTSAAVGPTTRSQVETVTPTGSKADIHFPQTVSPETPTGRASGPATGTTPGSGHHIPAQRTEETPRLSRTSPGQSKPACSSTCSRATTSGPAPTRSSTLPVSYSPRATTRCRSTTTYATTASHFPTGRPTTRCTTPRQPPAASATS